MHYSNQQIACHTASTTTKTNMTIFVSIIHARKYSPLLLHYHNIEQTGSTTHTLVLECSLFYPDMIRAFEEAMALTNDTERKKEIQKLESDYRHIEIKNQCCDQRIGTGRS